MWSSARDIAAGDVVIVWLTREAVQSLTITPGKEFNGRFGCYKHDDLIGVPYGSKVASRNGKGFIHLLRPTPELWTLALPHRTQILYLADIAFITAWLGIRPGSRVIEAGTGSGSFSHSVARTIGSAGRLFSFEFHQSRVEKARAEFAQHGMAGYVELHHRNVCRDGFGLKDHVDSVFLDLPAPWDAIPHAKEAMRKDRMTRICCFSPCVEQVLRTVSTLNGHGFSDITMYETLLRPHEVSQFPSPTPISIVRDRLQAAELRKETRRLQQIAAARARKAEGEDKPNGDEGWHSERRKRDADDGLDCSVDSAKRARIEESSDEESEPKAAPTSLTVTQPVKEVRGHTSYLTFACLPPTEFPPQVLTQDAVRDAVPEPEQMTPEPERQGKDDSDEIPHRHHDSPTNELVDQRAEGLRLSHT